MIVPPVNLAACMPSTGLETPALERGGYGRGGLRHLRRGHRALDGSGPGKRGRHHPDADREHHLHDRREHHAAQPSAAALPRHGPDGDGHRPAQRLRLRGQRAGQHGFGALSENGGWTAVLTAWLAISAAGMALCFFSRGVGQTDRPAARQSRACGS